MIRVLFTCFLVHILNGIYVSNLPIKTPLKWSKGFSAVYNDTLYYFGGVIDGDKQYLDVSSLDLSLMNIQESGGVAIVENKSVEWDTVKTNILPISFGYMYSESILAESQVSTSINNLVYIFNARSNLFPFSNHLIIFDLNTLQYKSNNTYSSNSYQILHGICTTNNISHIFGIGGIAPNLLLFHEIQIYDISANRWSLGDGLNDDREGAGCAYLSIYHYVYIFGGDGNNTMFMRNIEKYDTMQDIWSDAGDLIQRRYYTKCVANNLKDKIYCIAGQGDKESSGRNRGLNSIEEYDPFTERSKIVGYLKDKKWDFMVNIYYNDAFVMLMVFGGVFVNYPNGRYQLYYYDLMEYSLFENNTYQHPKNPYLIGWSMQNSFCFPIYWYPVFVVCSSILFFICISLLNAFKNVDDESDKSQRIIQKRKDDAIQAIVSCSSLPIDIANVIVSEFLYGTDDDSLLIKLLNHKLSIKRNITAQFLYYYNIIGGIFYLTVFCIIIWEHANYNTQQHESYNQCTQHSLNNNNCNKYETWDSFQGWIMSILIIHPMLIPINYIHAAYILVESERLKWKQRWICTMILPYLLIFCCCVLPGFVTMWIPSVFVYLPTLLMFAILSNVFCVWIYFVKDTLFQSMLNNPIIALNFGLIIGCILYMIVVIMMASIWCFYDGNHWNRCFIWGLTSGYCPNITVDWTDWKALIMLTTWILF